MNQDSHGSIVFAIDSIVNDNAIHYDANVESDILHNKWKEHKLYWMKALLTTLNKLDNMIMMLAYMLKRLEEKVVTPLSAERKTQEWFTLRIFSFTSCTSDKIINTMLKLNEDYLHSFFHFGSQKGM